MIDSQLFYRRDVMSLLSDNLTRVSDRDDFIIFEKDNNAAVFNVKDCTLGYYVAGQLEVVYHAGRMLLIFAIRRSLVDNFFS